MYKSQGYTENSSIVIKNKLVGLILAHTEIKSKWHNIIFKCIKLLIVPLGKNDLR